MMMIPPKQRYHPPIVTLCVRDRTILVGIPNNFDECRLGNCDGVGLHTHAEFREKKKLAAFQVRLSRTLHCAARHVPTLGSYSRKTEIGSKRRHLPSAPNRTAHRGRDHPRSATSNPPCTTVRVEYLPLAYRNHRTIRIGTTM